MDCECKINCPYFPDMFIKENDWECDKEKPYIKRRKEQKIFVCNYDGHPINWKTPCPRMLGVNDEYNCE